MRIEFDNELSKLNDDLIMMGALCEDAISCAIKALEEGNEKLCDKASDYEKKIDAMEDSIQSECLKLLLEQQPVAVDLRNISSALKMITDMERIGDQAEDIANIGKYSDLRGYIGMSDTNSMAKEAVQMVTSSIDAFVKKDAELAARVIENDDVVDDMFIKVRSDVIMMIRNDSSEAEKEVDLLMVAKYLERIADHATNIAEWVIFSITGEREHNELKE